MIRKDLERLPVLQPADAEIVENCLVAAWFASLHWWLDCNAHAKALKSCFCPRQSGYCTPHCSYHWCSWRAWALSPDSLRRKSADWYHSNCHHSCDWASCRPRHLDFSCQRWTGSSLRRELALIWLHFTPCFQICRLLCWIVPLGDAPIDLARARIAVV